MSKSILKKGILVLVVIVLLTIGFTGCSLIIFTTGTVYISIANDSYWYDIYIDGVWWEETDGSGNLTLYDVPIGYRYFEAYDTSPWNLYGSKWQYIHSGTNFVTIDVY